LSIEQNSDIHCIVIDLCIKSLPSNDTAVDIDRFCTAKLVIVS